MKTLLSQLRIQDRSLALPRAAAVDDGVTASTWRPVYEPYPRPPPPAGTTPCERAERDAAGTETILTILRFTPRWRTRLVAGFHRMAYRV